MHKRLLSAGLWSFAAVYAGSMLHSMVGTSQFLGPAIGLATAALIVSNPVARLYALRTTRVVVEPTALTGELA